MKKTAPHFLLASIIFVLSVGLLIVSEFLFTPNTFYFSYMTVLLLLILIFLVIKLPAHLKKKLHHFTKLFLFSTAGLLAFHALFNGLNVYQMTTVSGHSTLPEFFYTFKIYRLVSLSAPFMVTLVFMAVTLHIAAAKSAHTFVLPKLKWYQILILTYLLVVGLVHSQRALALVYKDTLQVAVNTNAAFADRHTYRLGGITYYGWIWPYTRFIVRHTPDTAVIAIPPQAMPWKMEGNLDYLRWYIHPRTMVKQLPDGTFPASTEYILITLGDCGEGDCGWPKTSLSADKIESIALIERNTEEETVLTQVEYTLDTNKFQWGIIKLKK